MKIIWYIFFVPFVYFVGTLADIYFACEQWICKKLEIGYYRKRTPTEMAEVLISGSQHIARFKRELQEAMKYL